MSEDQISASIVAWRKACELYHKVDNDPTIHPACFLDEFVCLMVIHGDPTKEVPRGVITHPAVKQ